jgi:hypothetical protein
MVTPSNDAMNNLACTAEEIANSVVIDHQAMVIRLYASETEVAIALHLANRERHVAPNAGLSIPQRALDEAVVQILIACGSGPGDSLQAPGEERHDPDRNAEAVAGYWLGLNGPTRKVPREGRRVRGRVRTR